jgi:hypothetical protein
MPNLPNSGFPDLLAGFITVGSGVRRSDDADRGERRGHQHYAGFASEGRPGALIERAWIDSASRDRFYRHLELYNSVPYTYLVRLTHLDMHDRDPCIL